METCSSGEDLFVKARKPYTITKQRERWTDEEHGRFLEAVKLYGRAWQKIEEHVGTKTAIQIRSHAQKFFTKLEKEALRNGLPSGQAHDIDIPPPRPKRKPCNPYPRKTCAATKLANGESLCSRYQRNDSEKDGCTKPDTNESCERSKAVSDNSHRSGVLTSLKDASCTSVNSVNKDLGCLNLTGKVLPLLSVVHGEFVQEKATIVDKNNSGNLIARSTETRGKCVKIDRKAPSDEILDGKKADEIAKLPKNLTQVAGCDSNFDPMHLQGNTNEKSEQTINADLTAHGSSNIFAVPSFAALTPSIHHISGFPSCTIFQNNQDGYNFFNISPVLSDLIVSTLQQNPAVHAAARLAASYWPCLNGEVSPHSESCTNGIPEKSANTTPTVAAIAAATVAAASAWWAMHGLVPFCHPFPSSFSFAPLSMMTNAMPTTNEAANIKDAKDDISLKDFGAQVADGQILQNSNANLSPQQSSDSDESEKYEDTNMTGLKESTENMSSSAAVTGCHDPNSKAKLKKKQYRSSCGSNTPSSSDETDIMLGDLNKDNEEVKDKESLLLTAESNNRRTRSSGTVSESWKEVSEEGKLAFQALFSREVLPQSFSPPSKDDMGNKLSENAEESNTSFIDLNSKKSWMDEYDCDSVQSSDTLSLKGGFHSDNSLSLGHSGVQGKLKARRIGFKPYKRCFVEAKEARVISGDENVAKRIRIEDEAST